MAEDKKESTSSSPLQEDPEDPVKSAPSSPNSSTRKACYAVLQSWVSKKFMTGCVVLFPVAVTFFITWWFIQFVDGFFSPIYERLGIDIFVKAGVAGVLGKICLICEDDVLRHMDTAGPYKRLQLTLPLNFSKQIRKRSRRGIK